MDHLEDTLGRTVDDWGTVSTYDWTEARTLIRNPGNPAIEITKEKAQDAVLRFRGQDVTLLNFASGVSPGGGVRAGANAQEEDLCRCSGLLHGLETLPEYYFANQADEAPPEGFDVMIESEQVPFIKDGDLRWVDPFRVRVFSYPAPNFWRGTITSDLAAKVFLRRASQIVHRAAELGTEVLLLGAWGCGAYANDPHHVASAFKQAIAEFSGGIQTVVFPIYGNKANYQTFREMLDR